MNPFQNPPILWKILRIRRNPTARSSEKPTYSNLSTGELASTSASDSDISDTEPFLESLSPPSRRRSNLHTIIAFAVLNIAALMIIYALFSDGFSSSGIEGLFPPATYEPRTFHDLHIMPSPASDAAWAAALPQGDGFTIVPDPERWDLPPGLPYGEGTTRYGVTWAHQFHCVWTLRDFFFATLANTTSSSSPSSSSSSPPISLVNTPLTIDPTSPAGEKLWHLAHCLDYLRQTITCTMDMTVEYPTLAGGSGNEGEGPGGKAINGYGIGHVCRKREPIDAYMAAHAPDATKIPGEAEREGHSHVHGVDDEIGA